MDTCIGSSKVPRDLRNHYAPKTHLTFCLRITDRKEAECKPRKEAVRLDEEFEAIRRLRSAPVQTELPEADIRRLADLWFHELPEGDEIARRDGLGAREAYAKAREQFLAATGKARYPTHEPAPQFGMNRREFTQTGETLELSSRS